MPFNPKKCCGKNVRFTPINIEANWIFSHLGFGFNLNIILNQWVRPAIIANTAPIDNT